MDRSPRNTPEGRGLLSRYAIAVLPVVLLTLVRFDLESTIGYKSPFIIYLPAVMLASWYGGVGPGCAAIALGGLTGFYFFTQPPGSFTLGEPTDLVVVGLYVAAGLMLVLVHDSQRRAQRTAEANALDSRRKEEQLAHEAEEREAVAVELRHANQRFRMAAEAVSGFIFEYDVLADTVYRPEDEHEIVSCAPDSDDPTLAQWIDRIDPDDRESVRDIVLDALANRESYSAEYRTGRSGARQLTVWERGVVQRGADGKAQRIIGYIMDITARQEAEKERARHLAEIEALNARLQRAMTETHHRVKNNLQVVTALLDMQTMQERECVPPSELRRLIRHIRAISMIHDLLTSGTKEDATVREVSAATAIHKLVPLLRQVAENRSIRMEVADTLLTVRQATALIILVQELVSNAVKHGHGPIEVRLIAAQGSATLEVCDDGPGFPAGFDPQKAANTGLDLIESLGRWDLGGQVTYENRPGGGGRAVVTFPLVHHAAVNAIAAPQPRG